MDVDGWHTCLRSPELVSKGKHTCADVINAETHLSDLCNSLNAFCLFPKWAFLWPEEEGKDHLGSGHHTALCPSVVGRVLFAEAGGVCMQILGAT